MVSEIVPAIQGCQHDSNQGSQQTSATKAHKKTTRVASSIGIHTIENEHEPLRTKHARR